MQVTMTFRHMEQSDALKAYAEEKLERVTKYIDGPINVQVYFSVEKKIRHIVEIVINSKGVSTKASESTHDMYAAIDAVIDKIERQLVRYKEKLKLISRAGMNMAVSSLKRFLKPRVLKPAPGQSLSKPPLRPPSRC